jgi:hypothetical protein
MKSAGALGMVALMIAVLAAGVVVCPCAGQPSDRDHGCCAQGAAFRAAGSDCCAQLDASPGVAASVEAGPAVLVTDVVAPLPAPAPAPESAARSTTFAFSVSPPTVLRI